MKKVFTTRMSKFFLSRLIKLVGIDPTKNKNVTSDIGNIEFGENEEGSLRKMAKKDILIDCNCMNFIDIRKALILFYK